MKVNTIEEALELHAKGKLVGCFDMPMSVYHHPKMPGLSKSKMTPIFDGPKAYLHSLTAPKDSKALLTGRAIHMRYLEPHLYNANFAVQPEGMHKGTKKYEEWLAPHAHKEILTAGEGELIESMAAELESKRQAKKLLAGFHEWSFFWVCEWTGELLRYRPDSIHPSYGLFADLKKAKSADPDKFCKQSFELYYHMSAAMGLDGIPAAFKQAGSFPIDFKMPKHCVFVAIEEKAPHRITYLDMPEDWIEDGRQCYIDAIRRIRAIDELTEEEKNSSYGEKIIRMKPKSYMYRRNV